MIMRTFLAAAAILAGAACDRDRPVPAPAAGSGENFSRTSAKTIELGTFEVTSGEILAGDPCYPKDEKVLHGTVRPVRTGSWKASALRINAGEWGPRNAELIAVHSAAKGPPSWEPQKGALGVDSGQLGIFDRAKHSDPSIVPRDYPWKNKPIVPDQPWYSLCCDQTLEEPGAGVIPFGAVSSSGLGDGAYDWHLWKEKGQIVGVRVVFLPE